MTEEQLSELQVYPAYVPVLSVGDLPAHLHTHPLKYDLPGWAWSMFCCVSRYDRVVVILCLMITLSVTRRARKRADMNQCHILGIVRYERPRCAIAMP